MTIRIIVLGLLLGYIVFRIYKYYIDKSTEKFNPLFNDSDNPNDVNKDNDSYNDNALYNDKHVRFNNNIDVIEYESGLRYSIKDNSIIDESELSNIVDDLLKQPIVENKNENEYENKNKKCLTSLINIDKNKMFEELENEINDKYDKYSNSEFYEDIDRSALSTNILNTNNIKNFNVNHVINPNCHTEMLANADENTTIWEQFDKMTTNNYKQFDKLDNLTPNNLAQNNWTLGSNDEYGSKFDNYSVKVL